MAHGNKVLRCAPEQLREMSPEQEAALKFIPVEALAKQGKYAMIGAQTFTDLSEKAILEKRATMVHRVSHQPSGIELEEIKTPPAMQRGCG